jgi:hypothetical protein
LEHLLASIVPGLPANRRAISAPRTRPADSGRAS